MGQAVLFYPRAGTTLTGRKGQAPGLTTAVAGKGAGVGAVSFPAGGSLSAANGGLGARNSVGRPGKEAAGRRERFPDGQALHLYGNLSAG